MIISFEGSLDLSLEEWDAAEGDAAQAVQNAIGYTGVIVVSAEADHYEDAEPEESDEDESFEHLDESLSDAADHRWPLGHPMDPENLPEGW